MPGPFHQIRRFLRELKRRKVYRVAAVYAAVAFVVVQAASLTFPALNIPSWAYSLVVVLALLGFPLALVLAWAFEVTPEGVRRTTGGAEGAAAGEEGAGTAGGRRRVPLWVGAGTALLAAGTAGAWYLTGGGEPGPRAGERSVAVLPFQTLGEGANPTFTEGLHDGLLTRLANVSDLQVISRTSVLPYRDSRKSVPQIARELGVRWILEGGVQQVGDQVQVNAQLIDAGGDVHAWARSYRKELTPGNLFAIQTELTREIARSLEAELTAGERKRMERSSTDDLEAYRLYVRGRTLLDRRTGTAMRQAADFFRRAIEQDSSYALAWTGLADAQTLLVSYGHAPADSVLPLAMEAARRALELDPDLAEAHASLGLLHQDLGRDGPAAVRELERAVELKPSYARAHHWLGVLRETLGRVEEGLPSIERAVELDPMSPSIHVALSGAYSFVGRPREALEAARRTEELAPGYSLAPWAAGWALLSLGRPGEAAAAFHRALERTSPTPFWTAMARGWLAVSRLRTGDEARARQLLDRLEQDGRVPLAAAVVHAELENRDEALRLLEATDYEYFPTLILRYDPLLDPLREDPRFRALVRRVNEEWGLEPDGSFPQDLTSSVEAGRSVPGPMSHHRPSARGRSGG